MCSINQNDSLDHLLSAGSYLSVVLSPWVSLSCPSSSGHSTQILIPAFVSSAGSREHWCYPESSWQTAADWMWSISVLAQAQHIFAIWCYDMIIQLWKQERRVGWGDRCSYQLNVISCQFSVYCLRIILFLLQTVACPFVFKPFPSWFLTLLETSSVKVKVLCLASQEQWGMQAGKVSSLSAFPFGHADISICERSNQSKGKDVRVRSTHHVPWFPWQPEVVHAPVSKQPAGFHQCLRCVNVL